MSNGPLPYAEARDKDIFHAKMVAKIEIIDLSTCDIIIVPVMIYKPLNNYQTNTCSKHDLSHRNFYRICDMT